MSFEMKFAMKDGKEVAYFDLDGNNQFNPLTDLEFRDGRVCDGHKQEGECALPGEICLYAISYTHREVSGGMSRSQQKA